MKISAQLAKQAKQHDICQKWHDRLTCMDNKRDMVRMYIKGIDFCLANDYPDNAFIRKNFGDVINEFGVYLDDNVNLTNPAKCVALGCTRGTVEVNGFGTCEIFVKHESALKLTAKDNAYVMIDIFDNASLHVTAEGKAKVVVNRYGEAKIASDAGTGTVKIVEKRKKTY